MPKKINNSELFNSFKLIAKHLHDQLKNNLPNFDKADFFQVFGKKFEDLLSAEGKNTYAAGLNKEVLTSLLKEAHEKLNQAYQEILESAIRKVQTHFDPKRTENDAQEQFKLKLDQTKESLIKKLNAELADKNQEFSNPADKKALDTAFNSYLNTLGEKYKNNLNKINSIFSQLAKFKLHLSNQEAKLKVKDPRATFAITETDLDALSIGIKPDPSMGWKIDIDNLVERLMYRVASLKPEEKIHIVLNIPDRNGIIGQIGEIGFQGRSGTGNTVALAALLAFYILALIRNDDVKRMVTAFEKVIKEKGISIDPKAISYSIKKPTKNGKYTVIKEKNPLSSEDTILLQKANEELIENLRHQSDEGYESSSESEEQTQEESTSRASPRL
jgi:hypothetical protein